ncbi:Rabenosyn-5 [Dirofilaria immitis]|nr:Rabenosyn-5 [Dirofilaria immitis]
MEEGLTALCNDGILMDMDNNDTNDLGGAFRQGFLCPFCMQDLGDLTALHIHVGKYHPKSAPADYSFDHIKGKFTMALDRVENPLTQHTLLLFSGSWSHTDFYLKCRSPCINDAAVKTNSLIIRLDKLINQCPSDSNKRKAFEREIVPWVIDRDVVRCRTCSMKFSLTRRRHHCRLCGEIICQTCSKFLSFVDARKLTNPAFAAQLLEEINSESNIPDEPLSHMSRSTSVAEAIKQAVSSESLQSVRLKSEKLFSSTLSLVKRDGTEVSLASLLQQDENEHLRICSDCKILLDIRNEKMEMLASPPMLVVLYERLCSLFRDAQKLASSYVRISESLSRGETMYTLDSAVQLRNRLIQLQREIDSVSSRVDTHRVTGKSTFERCTPREQIIRKNIRDFSLQMLQRLMVQMNLHPSEDRYNELQEKRRADIKHRIDMERKRNAFIITPSTSNPGLSLHLSETEMIQQNSKSHLKDPVSFSGIVGGCEDYGWIPSRMFLHANPFIEEGDKVDPLQEQILIIKGYLKQAVEDSRLEEVEILERNLCDLEREIEKLNNNTSSVLCAFRHIAYISTCITRLYLIDCNKLL